MSYNVIISTIYVTLVFVMVFQSDMIVAKLPGPGNAILKVRHTNVIIQVCVSFYLIVAYNVTQR